MNNTVNAIRRAQMGMGMPQKPQQNMSKPTYSPASALSAQRPIRPPIQGKPAGNPAIGFNQAQKPPDMQKPSGQAFPPFDFSREQYNSRPGGGFIYPNQPGPAPSVMMPAYQYQQQVQSRQFGQQMGGPGISADRDRFARMLQLQNGQSGGMRPAVQGFMQPPQQSGTQYGFQGQATPAPQPSMGQPENAPAAQDLTAFRGTRGGARAPRRGFGSYLGGAGNVIGNVDPTQLGSMVDMPGENLPQMPFPRFMR